MSYLSFPSERAADFKVCKHLLRCFQLIQSAFCSVYDAHAMKMYGTELGLFLTRIVAFVLGC